MTHRAPLRRLAGVSWWGVAGWGAAVIIPLAFLGMFFLWPVVTLVGRGFLGETGGLDLTGFADVFSRARTWRVIAMTLVQAAGGTVLSVLLGVPAAYVLYRLAIPGARWWRAAVTIPFVMPTVVVGVAFRAVFRADGPLGFLGWDQSLAAIIAALAFFNVAVVARTVGGLWERLDPRAEQAAATLGASPWRVWWTVTLPRLAPAVSSAAAVVFLYCATSFGTVLVLGGRRYGTVETEIYRLTVQYLDLRGAAVLSVVQLVIVTASLLAADRSRRRRERALSMTPPGLARRRPRGRGDATVIGAVAVSLGVLQLLPVAFLVARSFKQPDGQWGLGNYRTLSQPGLLPSASQTVWDAAVTSLQIAAVAAALAVVLGVAIALVSSRRPRARIGQWGTRALDGVFMLPLGVSAVTVGFGLLLTMSHPLGLPIDLRSSAVMLPIAQAVVAVPLVVRTVSPVLRGIDPRLRQAAATLGASPGRVLRTIDLPVAARSIGLALGFALAASVGEFGASSFLVRPEVQTLPVVVFSLIGRQGAGYYEAALAASVVLVAVGAGVMMLAELVRPGSVKEG